MIDEYRQIIYEDLPKQNLAFVEGGVLIYPKMLGLNLPITMDEKDLYQYLHAYISFADSMSKVKDEQQGRRTLRKYAESIPVDHQKLEKDTTYIYMTESVMNGKLLDKSFESIKKIYTKQAQRARVMLMDVIPNIDQDLIKRTNKKKVDITPKSNEKILQQNTAILDSATPILELETTTLVKMPEDDSTKSFFTKPPVIVGLVALSTYALFNFMPKKEEFIS